MCESADETPRGAAVVKPVETERVGVGERERKDSGTFLLSLPLMGGVSERQAGFCSQLSSVFTSPHSK